MVAADIQRLSFMPLHPSSKESCPLFAGMCTSCMSLSTVVYHERPDRRDAGLPLRKGRAGAPSGRWRAVRRQGEPRYPCTLFPDIGRCKP